jgi:drug/metabolite transporter (DMT)-like permease
MRSLPDRHSPRIDAATTGGLLAIVLWSTTFALARSLSEQVGPLSAGAAVYLVGAVLGFIQLRRASGPRHPFRVSLKYALGCGFLFVLYTALLYIAVGLAATRSQLLEVALINYLWPAATILLSVPLLGKKARWPLLPGTAIALLGVFLVLTQDTAVTFRALWEHALSSPLAYGSVLVAAIAWALYSNLARLWANGESAGGVPLFTAAAGLVLLVLRFAMAEHSTWTFRASLESLTLGAVTAAGYGLWDRAMRKGDLLLVASCSYLTPLLSTLVSCLYLQVAPGGRLWWGCLLLIGGTLLSWRSVRDEGSAQCTNG